MRKGRRGFSMIELMVVIAVIGVLAMLAAPRYLGNVARARVAEGLVLLGPVKTAVAEYRAVHGHMPTATNWLALLKELGLPVSTVSGAASGAYVERIWWNNTAQEIRVRFGVFPVDGKLLTLAAHTGEYGIHWTCSAPSGDNGIPQQYLPASCRN